MSAKVKRMERSTNSVEEDEIFMEISIVDDLGEYPHAKWLDADDVDDIKEVCPEFIACNSWRDFKTNPAVLEIVNTIKEQMEVVGRINKLRELNTQPPPGVN
jgi:hypothetical protein